jgi:hypothetical protein
MFLCEVSYNIDLSLVLDSNVKTKTYISPIFAVDTEVGRKVIKFLRAQNFLRSEKRSKLFGF